MTKTFSIMDIPAYSHNTTKFTQPLLDNKLWLFYILQRHYSEEWLPNIIMVSPHTIFYFAEQKHGHKRLVVIELFEYSQIPI